MCFLKIKICILKKRNLKKRISGLSAISVDVTTHDFISLYGLSVRNGYHGRTAPQYATVIAMIKQDMVKILYACLSMSGFFRIRLSLHNPESDFPICIWFS